MAAHLLGYLISLCGRPHPWWAEILVTDGRQCSPANHEDCPLQYQGYGPKLPRFLSWIRVLDIGFSGVACRPALAASDNGRRQCRLRAAIDRDDHRGDRALRWDRLRFHPSAARIVLPDTDRELGGG